jgi:hypothetical protein
MSPLTCLDEVEERRVEQEGGPTTDDAPEGEETQTARVSELRRSQMFFHTLMSL